MLLRALRSNELEQVRPALKGWLRIAIIWQVMVLAGCGVYLLALTSRHGHGIAWISPAVGAVFGTALPLQFVVVAILRSARNAQ